MEPARKALVSPPVIREEAARWCDKPKEPRTDLMGLQKAVAACRATVDDEREAVTEVHTASLRLVLAALEGVSVERQRYSGDGVWLWRWVGPWVEEP